MVILSRQNGQELGRKKAEDASPDKLVSVDGPNFS